MKKGLEWFLPGYTRIPLAAVICVNCVAYFLTRLFTRYFVHFDFTLPIDKALPFIPAFSVIYVLAYVQWVVGFVLVARESRELCYSMMSGEIAAKFICMMLFIFVPTTMVRADITGNDFFSNAVRLIYRIDTPDNLFPSLHCLESWFCFRGAMQMKKTGKLYLYFSLIFTLLVFASTVLVKQHEVVDIIAGVVVLELGLLISKKFNLARVFVKAEALLCRRANTESDR